MGPIHRSPSSSGLLRNLPEMARNGARRICFLLIWTLPTFWAERILILITFIFGIFLDPKFPDFQVPDFQISRNLAWAGLGPWAGWQPFPKEHMQFMPHLSPTARLPPGWLEFWKSRNLGIWKSRNMGSKKIQKKIVNIKICVAQNVGSVQISRKKNLGPIWGHFRQFFPWAGEIQKKYNILPIFRGGPMGPIHPVWALAAIHPRWGNR